MSRYDPDTGAIFYGQEPGDGAEDTGVSDTGKPLLPRTMWTTYHHDGERFLCIWRQWFGWTWDETHIWLPKPTAGNR